MTKTKPQGSGSSPADTPAMRQTTRNTKYARQPSAAIVNPIANGRTSSIASKPGRDTLAFPMTYPRASEVPDYTKECSDAATGNTPTMSPKKDVVMPSHVGAAEITCLEPMPMQHVGRIVSIVDGEQCHYRYAGTG